MLRPFTNEATIRSWEWSQIVEWQSLQAFEHQAPCTSWCHTEAKGKNTIPAHSRGCWEEKPALMSGGGVPAWCPGQNARATNLFLQPKYCRPRGACCLGLPSRVWGSSRLHRCLCWLLSKTQRMETLSVSCDQYRELHDREKNSFPIILKVSNDLRPRDMIDAVCVQLKKRKKIIRFNIHLLKTEMN